ncbi:MAG TPA: DNA polymerase III subunit chi [Rickettsia endosymbiont of Pyrocoelia pectoralis]|nr:DNA polymerase III subunit chi [Rickettsia endosymbiont of Pyrocoelia pectoralis]
MQQFSIYQTTDELLLKAIFLLIEKCYYSDLKSVVLTVDTDQQEMLNKNLWTYSRKQFIPHGSKLDPKPEKQPVYITDELQNPNDATVLISLDIEKLSQAKDRIKAFKRIILITDLAKDSKELNSKINNLTNSENTIDCFRQDAKGAWNKIDTTNK